MIIIFLALVGVCVGSFVNALVWRLRQQSLPVSKQSRVAVGKDLSIVTGRSMCVHCGHELQPLDLIPVFSYIALKGKCRYCSKPIEDKPYTELAGLLLFVISYVVWPYGFEARGVFMFVVWLVSSVFFISLSLYDIKWKLLPNKLVYLLLVLVISARIIQALFYGGDANEIREAVLGLICLGGVFYALFSVSDGNWIGGGDVKLGFALGALVGGPISALLVLFLASLLGLIASVPSLITKRDTNKLKMQIPFGPFLLLAATIIYLDGGTIVSWYKDLFLL